MVINVKNKLWIFGILILIVIVICGIVYFYNNKEKNDNSKYQADRASQNSSVNNSNSDYNSSQNDVAVQIENKTENQVENKTQTTPAPAQEEIVATFTTKIYNKDSARQNNIKITCNTLNNSIVRNGTTFSFCDTIGPATSEKGYQEADIFDKEGHKKKGLGGGNCQVSTTLYNAVLKTPNMTVIERHEHSNKVPYISKGKDAAVAYGGYDLKFKNNTGFDIMIKTEATASNITMSLISSSFLNYFSTIIAFGKYLSPIGVEVLFTTFPL